MSNGNSIIGAGSASPNDSRQQGDVRWTKTAVHSGIDIPPSSVFRPVVRRGAGVDGTSTSTEETDLSEDRVAMNGSRISDGECHSESMVPLTDST